MSRRNRIAWGAFGLAIAVVIGGVLWAIGAVLYCVGAFRAAEKLGYRLTRKAKR